MLFCLFLACGLWRTSVARPFEVVSAPTGVGHTIWAGAIDGRVATCRAPFGQATVFISDAGRIFIAQHDSQRRVALTLDEVQTFAGAIKDDLQAFYNGRQSLLDSRYIDQDFKERVFAAKTPPDPKLSLHVLQITSTPASDATSEGQFARLNHALSQLRTEVQSRGLERNAVSALLTCAYDLSQIPMNVSGRDSAESTRFERRPRKHINSESWLHYRQISLHSLIDGLGMTAEIEDEGRQ